jgi:hypothetical protein
LKSGERFIKNVEIILDIVSDNLPLLLLLKNGESFIKNVEIILGIVSDNL